MSDTIEGPWHTDQFWTSHFNYQPEVREKLRLPDKVLIHDTTLRDGAQTPGIFLDVESKVKIGLALEKAGVDRIEIGKPGYFADDQEVAGRLLNAGINALVYGHCPADPTHVDAAAACGCQGVIIETPIGYPRLKWQFGWDWEEVFQRSTVAIHQARKHGLAVTFFPFDGTRAEPSDYEKLLGGLAKEARPDSVAIVDTHGCAIPEAIVYMVDFITQVTDGIPVEIHAHNDLGMATANSLAAVAAGAQVVHASINGLGERSGNAPLEEVATALRTLYGIESRIKFHELSPLSQLVTEMTGMPLSLNKAVIGLRTFTRESEGGIQLLKEFPLAMFSLDPHFVGQVPRVVLGRNATVKTIMAKATEFDLQVDEGRLPAVLTRVKETVEAERQPIVEKDEFVTILKQEEALA
jgi:isopropylmalate/homocitrate/citramalate synthase